MFDDLVDCKRILRETAIMTRPIQQCAAPDLIFQRGFFWCRLSHPHIVQIYDIIES